MEIILTKEQENFLKKIFNTDDPQPQIQGHVEEWIRVLVKKRYRKDVEAKLKVEDKINEIVKR